MSVPWDCDGDLGSTVSFSAASCSGVSGHSTVGTLTPTLSSRGNPLLSQSISAMFSSWVNKEQHFCINVYNLSSCNSSKYYIYTSTRMLIKCLNASEGTLILTTPVIFLKIENMAVNLHEQ